MDLDAHQSPRVEEEYCHTAENIPLGATTIRSDWHATLRGRSSGDVYAVVYGYWVFVDDGTTLREVVRCFKVASLPEKHASYHFGPEGIVELSVLDESSIIENVPLNIESADESGKKGSIARTGWRFTFTRSHGAIAGTVAPLDVHGVTRHPNGTEPPLDGSFVPAIHELGIDSVEVTPETSIPLPHGG